jgi:MOSC domain-containing protein YiiM
MPAPALTLQRIFISEGHRFVGRHGLAPAAHPIREVPLAWCVAGRGLHGDRYFSQPTRHNGQVTLFSAGIFERLRAELTLPAAQPSALRRNLLVGGSADLNALIGRVFSLQTISLRGLEECRPCHWMDDAIGPGAEAWLRGRGGLRCAVLSSGWLRAETEAAPC